MTMPLPIVVLQKATHEMYYPLWQLRNELFVRKAMKGLASFGDFIKEIEHHNNHFLAGLVGTDLVGYAQLTVMSSNSISLFVTTEQFNRRKGYGKQLVDAAFLWAIHSGYQHVMAAIEQNNSAGIALIRRCAFVDQGVAPSKNGGLKNIYVRRA